MSICVYSVMSNSLWPHGQAPQSLGFPRQEHWSVLPFPSPGDLSDQGIESVSLVPPALAGGFFTIAPPGKPLCVSESKESLTISTMSVDRWVIKPFIPQRFAEQQPCTSNNTNKNFSLQENHDLVEEIRRVMEIFKERDQDFPDGTVDKSLPSNAGDMVSIPGLQGFHMPQSHWAPVPQLPTTTLLATTAEAFKL